LKAGLQPVFENIRESYEFNVGARIHGIHSRACAASAAANQANFDRARACA